MKTKILIVFALGMGIYNAGTWAVIFWLFRNGHSVYEPDILIATIELSFAVFLTFLAVLAFIFYLRRLKVAGKTD